MEWGGAVMAHDQGPPQSRRNAPGKSFRVGSGARQSRWFAGRGTFPGAARAAGHSAARGGCGDGAAGGAAASARLAEHTRPIDGCKRKSGFGRPARAAPPPARPGQRRSGSRHTEGHGPPPGLPAAVRAGRALT
jgi:hypothetical protein